MKMSKVLTWLSNYKNKQKLLFPQVVIIAIITLCAVVMKTYAVLILSIFGIVSCIFMCTVALSIYADMYVFKHKNTLD